MYNVAQKNVKLLRGFFLAEEFLNRRILERKMHIESLRIQLYHESVVGQKSLSLARSQNADQED